MPRVTPNGEVVNWPLDEGTLGVVGVAPWATLEFCRTFYSLFQAPRDWHYPRVLLDVNTKIPSRGRHFELGERDPSPYIAATIKELADAGATVAVVACNTAHLLYDRWSRESPIPIVHIIDAAVVEAREAGARRVVALTSASLMRHDTYGLKAEAAGLSYVHVSDELQVVVSGIIDHVKTTGELPPEGDPRATRLLGILSEQALDIVIIGCTELSGLGPSLRRIGLHVVDSNMAAARAAYLAIGGGECSWPAPSL